MPITDHEIVRQFAVMVGMPEMLVTERLTMCRLRASDASLLMQIANDWEVAKQTTTLPYPYRLSDAEALIEHAADAAARGQEIILAITRSSDGRLMGLIGLTMDTTPVEVGYWLGVPYWGQGYASEALTGVLEMAAQEMPVRELEAVVFAENQASARVLRKCGFSHIGDFTEIFPERGGERIVSRYRREFGGCE